MKRTKIIATLGPITSSQKIIKQLIDSGMNVARINFSHGTHQSNGEVIDRIKEIRKNTAKSVGIIADLQGPRIRTLVDKELKIKKGELVGVWDNFKKSQRAITPIKHFTLDWSGIIKKIAVGDKILIEDGLMQLQVISKEKNYLKTQVIEGGIIKNHKGVNIPDSNLKMSAVTAKDEDDLKFVLNKGVDFIALSFVSSAQEIIKVREKIKKIIGPLRSIPHIIAKIERKEAIKNIQEIIRVADAIMVARGDLGIELDESRVVIYQKEIIAHCLRSATPVIVATQMLNSMIENSHPTRAEVSDVSNAVIDHADAVMLSGETANGKYPVRSVKVMREIIQKTENSPFDILKHGFLQDRKQSVSAAVAHGAHELLKDTKAKAIVSASMSGFSARMITRHRPEKPIFVMTNKKTTYNQLSLVWGVEGFILPDCQSLDDLIDQSVETLKKAKVVKKQDKIIIVTGRPHAIKEHMSLIKVEEVK